jgi:hypothetical protein
MRILGNQNTQHVDEENDIIWTLNLMLIRIIKSSSKDGRNV